jgi:hypothetical protein
LPVYSNSIKMVRSKSKRQRNSMVNKMKPLDKIQTDGQFRVNSSGFYQMIIHTKYSIEIDIDGQISH